MGETSWSRRRSDELAGSAATTVIVPIGSTEQHGPHLPVQVDALLVGEVAARTAALMADALVTPTVWVSLAEHHMAFAGTLTLDFDGLRAVLRGIVGSLARQGFSRILLLNGHGGNILALPIIADELARAFAVPVATTTYWVAAAAEFAGILEGQTALLHACEAETSMVMALAPELVDMSRLDGVTPPVDGFAAPVHRWRPMREWTPSGVVGRPELASAAKGERLFDAAAAALARLLS